MRVTGVEPNRRIDMEAAFGPVRPRFSLTFEPTGNGTYVTMRGDSRPVGPFKLVPFLMDRIGQRNWDRRLGLMKSRPRRRARSHLAPPKAGFSWREPPMRARPDVLSPPVAGALDGTRWNPSPRADKRPLRPAVVGEADPAVLCVYIDRARSLWAHNG